MALPNLNNPTKVEGKTDVWAATNTITTRITAAANSTVLVKSIRATNIHASTVGWATAIVDHSGTDYRYSHQVDVPLNGSVELITGVLDLNGDDGDLLQLQANASSNIEFVTTYFVVT